MSRALLIPQLLTIFRQYGYEGASLSKISELTGLGRASLYHHFPKGKQEMVQAVMTYLQERRDKYIFEPLKGTEPPAIRLKNMAQALIHAYEQGRVLCMLSILTVSESRQQFLPQVQPVFIELIDAIAVVVMEAGFTGAVAKERAEDAVLSIQGALILSHALDKNDAFLRVMNKLPAQLLATEL